MTLIVTIEDETGFLTFNDLLITNGLDKGGVINVIPAVWGNDDVPNIHVTNLKRKSFLIRPNVMFLWAGSLDLARVVLTKLVAIPSSYTNDRLKAEIRSILSSFKDHNISIQVVVRLFSNSEVIFINCDQFTMACLGKVTIAGTGKYDCISQFEDLTFSRAIGSATLFHKAALVEHCLLWQAIFRASESVFDKWGGGIETFFTNDNGFIALDHVVHSFVDLRRENGVLHATPHAYLISKRYYGNRDYYYDPETDLTFVEFNSYKQLFGWHIVPSFTVSNDQRIDGHDVRMAWPTNEHYFVGVVSLLSDSFKYQSLLVNASDLLLGVQIPISLPATISMTQAGLEKAEGYISHLISGSSDKRVEMTIRLPTFHGGTF
jgi:hypothetical protein